MNSNQQFCFLFFIAACSAFLASVSAFSACGGRVFIEDAVIIDAPTDADCVWQIETETDRILAISAVRGENLQQLLTIRDGLVQGSPILLAKDQQEIVYTTQSTVEIRLKTMPTTSPASNFQLKIQKAVACPTDLGLESNCTRLVDDVSCHCASFTKRNQTDQKAFCEDNGMLLVSIETPEEDQAISDTWGLGSDFWTSCVKNFGRWVWEATGKTLYPGYVNWYPIAEPFCNDQWDANYTCMLIGYNGLHWASYHCDGVWGAVCELHP